MEVSGKKPPLAAVEEEKVVVRSLLELCCEDKLRGRLASHFLCVVSILKLVSRIVMKAACQYD